MTDEKQAALDFMKAVNNMAFDPEKFADLVCDDHRTLQQNAMRAFTACIKRWAVAYDEGRFDLRNDATCDLSSKIVDKFPDYLYFPHV